MHKTIIGRRRAATLLFALPLASLWAAPRAVSVANAAVDTAVKAAAAVFMADARAVGLSVGVIEAGNLHTHHFGSVSKRRKRRADDRTLYPIASLTKTFTGALLAQAQRDGKLKLDDDIRAYLDGDYPNLAFGDTPIRISRPTCSPMRAGSWRNRTRWCACRTKQATGTTSMPSA
ncbi:MAG: beta-lactamase [Massilia sp.]|jgi:D-alanyl-D-alanine-carboxypeptidase/D-alanyl-D-alanine-endopeptidase|nr:beta-lactamase [Massilia sp.]